MSNDELEKNTKDKICCFVSIMESNKCDEFVHNLSFSDTLQIPIENQIPVKKEKEKDQLDF